MINYVKYCELLRYQATQQNVYIQLHQVLTIADDEIYSKITH